MDMNEKLFSAVRTKLEENGTLSQLRSEFELKILNLVGITRMLKDKKRPTINGGNVIDELIAEYMDWCGYSISSSIFKPESCCGYPNNKKDRKEIMEELGLKLEEGTNESLPLLCHMINKLQKSDG